MSLDESGTAILSESASESEVDVWESANSQEAASSIEPGAYNTYKFFADANGRGIRIRHGYWNTVTDRGFGARKMYRKHNLTTGLAERFMKGGGYKSEMEDNGHVRRYRRPAILWHCIPMSPCGVVDDTFVRIPIETAKLPGDGLSRGLVTGYCEAPDHTPRCKDWVNNTF